MSEEKESFESVEMEMMDFRVMMCRVVSTLNPKDITREKLKELAPVVDLILNFARERYAERMSNAERSIGMREMLSGDADGLFTGKLAEIVGTVMNNPPPPKTVPPLMPKALSQKEIDEMLR